MVYDTVAKIGKPSLVHSEIIIVKPKLVVTPGDEFQEFGKYVIHAALAVSATIKSRNRAEKSIWKGILWKRPALAKGKFGINKDSADAWDFVQIVQYGISQSLKKTSILLKLDTFDCRLGIAFSGWIKAVQRLLRLLHGRLNAHRSPG
jgi:hypothetical protein